ncbi:uncharacterized protein UBRO2_04740 [Ustilago bromivora]|uniref:Uncharacterized protein n=1 Tax=Ustilago bromivora TaxID=307758 RepID=A0A8H8TVC4_9BASI|nr:uncharacterized protein UBRO2_04740 [Ustilago bromivora]
MEVQVKDKNGAAHIINTSNIGGYQPNTISKVVTILACNVNANYETVKVIQEFIASVRDDYLQQLEDLSNEWRSAGSNKGRTSIVHDLQRIVPATFTMPIATSSAPAAHLSTTTSSLKPAESTTPNGNSSAMAKHSSATSPSIACTASTQPVAASSEPLKHSSAKSSSSAPAATLANPFATSSEWHNDKQAELEDWKKDTDEEVEAHDKESEWLGFAGLDLTRKYVMEYRNGSSDDEPEVERDIDLALRREEDHAKVEKLLQQPDAEGKVVEEVDSDANLYCNMPPGDVIVPIQAGTMHTAESHDALGASQGPSMSYLQDTVEPPSKLPFAETPNTNVMEHDNSQPTNKQDAAMPGSGGAVPAPDVTKKCKGKMRQVRDPSLSPPPLSNPQ